MSKTNCRDVRREIEEAAPGELLTAPAREHLSNCATCATFGNEQQKLRDMVASLGMIEAPADFDFKLHARLAASRSSHRDLLSGNGFGIRSVAFATLVLLFGVVVILMSARSRSNESAPVAEANGPTSQTSRERAQINKNEQREEAPGARTKVAETSPTNYSNPTGLQSSPTVRNLTKHSGSSVSQFGVAHNGRVKATDLSVTPAPVLRPSTTAMEASVFPLGTSYQSLKVSVDDGRGSSRTISLPTVSFGSSRVLARNPAPVMAPVRDSW
jgi:hypothetical protein